MTLTTMDEARTELRALLGQQMAAAPSGTVVRNNELIAAFQRCELSAELRSQIFETGVSTILREVINPD